MSVNTITVGDGASIRYHQMGSGPGLIVLHGAMEWSLSHVELAEALSDTFTVYLPDRRGRGGSDVYAENDSVGSEVSDVAALLAATGADLLFGVSSGAIISLLVALRSAAVRKVAIFEPPLFPDSREPTTILENFDREIARGNLTRALVAGMKGARMGPALLRAIPTGLLAPLTAAAMKQDDKKASDEYVTMRALAPTLHHDFSLVLDASGPAARFAGIAADVLLLGGAKSPAYLKAALDALESAMPKANRVEFPDVGHGASGNADRGGKPALVAERLRRFFTEAPR